MAEELAKLIPPEVEYLLREMKPRPVWEDGVAADGRKGYLGNAREYLLAMREGKFAVIHTFAEGPVATDDPEYIALALKSSLSLAHKAFAALDPSGRKTEKEMEEEFEQTLKAAYIAFARQKFEAIKQSGGDDYRPIPEPYESMRILEGAPYERHGTHAALAPFLMERALRHAGVDASALDASGQKSAPEMEKEIQELRKRENISDARSGLGFLRYGCGDTEGIVRDIHEHLQRAGVDASALDPEGKRSAAEMERVIQQTERQGNLERARVWYEMSLNDEKTPERTEYQKVTNNMVKENLAESLAKAGVGIEALKDVYVTTQADQLSGTFTLHPEVVDRFVDSFNTANPSRTLSQDDSATLHKDPQFAAKFFSEGLKDVMAAGHASFSELHGQPEDMSRLVSSKKLLQALNDGAVSMKRLEALPMAAIRDAATVLQQADTPEDAIKAARLLGLDEADSRRFAQSVSTQVEASKKFFAIPTIPSVPMPSVSR